MQAGWQIYSEDYLEDIPHLTGTHFQASALIIIIMVSFFHLNLCIESCKRRVGEQQLIYFILSNERDLSQMGYVTAVH